ncbi:MAG: branched-chain amino acid ABC transporter permease [Deltaproteobacteria bacterium]|nr:branched-chain amino acid ABC transporter permease [Deltaproteobacteria bacterium]
MQGKDYIGFSVFVIFMLALPHWISNDYYLGVLVFTAFNCMACVGLCLLMGYAGQISLGHGAFVAIGAYAAGILTTHLGWSPWLAMGAGVLAAVFIALVIGVPSLRLKGHYLAMATLGFASIVHIVSVAAIDITNGPAGIIDIPRIKLFGFALDSDIRYYYFVWIIFAVGLFFAINLVKSRVGRGLRAIHGSEDAASAVGVNITRYKIQIFILSAVYAAVSGSLYAYYVNYIDPGPFDIMYSVLLVTMVAVGGLHSLWGAVAGGILLSLLPELLSMAADTFAGVGIAYKPDYDTIVYGGILLFIMLFMPEGLFGGISTLGSLVFKAIARMAGRRYPSG